MRQRLVLFILLLSSSMIIMAQDKEKMEIKDSVDVEHIPSFPGGNDAMYAYFSQNAKYPIESVKKDAQGYVVVGFIVEKDGKITNINIEKSDEPSFNKEALRVIRNMPKWNPGLFRGLPVSVRYNILIVFERKNDKGITIVGIPTIKTVVAALNDYNNENLRVLRQNKEVSGFDNHSFFVSYFNGSNVYNGRGVCMVKGNDSVVSVRISPALNTMLVLCRTDNGYQYAAKVDIDSKATNLINYDDSSLATVCYRPDARQIAIAKKDKQIVILNAMNDTIIKELHSSFVPQHMVFSDNGYYLVLAAGKDIEIKNMENGTVRTTFSTNAIVNDVVFADNNKKMLVTTADGSLIVYETIHFTEMTKINGLGTAKRCLPIGDGKYAAVLTSDQTISIMNLLNISDVITQKIGYGNTTNIGVGTDVTGDPWIVYNSNINEDYNAIGFYHIKGLKPYYNKMMESELTYQLNLWMKKMPNETLEEYKMRMNELSRSTQARQLALQITTQMAEEVLDYPVMSIGDYNIDTGQLTLHIDKMPDIYIDISPDEIESLNKSPHIQLRNIKYILKENDLFEVAYAEILNPITKNVYVYDKMKTEPLDLSRFDELLVPLDIVMKTNMEETSLMNIKDEIISLAKKEQVISDKTHISVVTQVSRDVSADGKNILNYDINFTYEVDQNFSARDDFKPGRFHTEESGAAMSMLKIMKKAFEKDFAKYIKEGKEVRICITGSADASPILKGIVYDGAYGEYQGEPVYKDNELTTISLTKEKGISDNNQLAFARAIGVQCYIEKEMASFKSMKHEYDYHIDVSKDEGSQFRRISVKCSFIDAF